MTNCTFSNNSAYQGGGIYNDGNSSITVTNCILWGNSSEIGNTNSNPTVTYSIVQGGYTGIGNLDANPRSSSMPPKATCACKPVPVLLTMDSIAPYQWASQPTWVVMTDFSIVERWI
ncbi:MAG: hypothetical protein H6559_32090 [Lewinellaceae bacterium]|nr:hypothetical protein [Lewinellaceae bacterium]